MKKNLSLYFFHIPVLHVECDKLGPLEFELTRFTCICLCSWHLLKESRS